MGYEYNTATAIAAAQNQASVTVNNHLSNSCTVSTAGHRSTCRSTPYTLRHKYIQDGKYKFIFFINFIIFFIFFLFLRYILFKINKSLDHYRTTRGSVWFSTTFAFYSICSTTRMVAT